MQKFIADGWPAKIWFGLVFVAWAAAVVLLVGELWPILDDWREVLRVVGLAAAMFAAAAGFGLIYGGVLLPPIYLYQATRNGAPFEPGDEVRILTGPGKGRIVRIYSLSQGNSVRLDLGEEARQALEDIYGPHQIERVSGTP